MWRGTAPWVFLSFILAAPALGETLADESNVTEGAPGAARRGLAIATAALPGVFWHGLGLEITRRPREARNLATAEIAGVALVTAGGLPLALSGASRKVSWPSVPLLVSGVGVFSTSWLAGVYGASGGGRRGAEPWSIAKASVDVGYATIRDVQFDYANFAVVEGTLRFARERVSPSAWLALDHDNQRWRLEGAHRFVGPLPGEMSLRGSFIDLVGALTLHHFGDEGFDTVTGEVALKGRLDLGSLGDALAGSFAELGTGLGIEVFHFRGGADDYTSLLLGDFAFGMWFGKAGETQGEVAVAYDHRRDDFAAGFASNTRGSGFGGHFGLRSALLLAEAVVVRGEVWAGAAQVFRLSAGWRFQ